MASRVEKRMALAFPVLRMETFARVIPTCPASSVTLILRFASMTSRLMTIAMGLHSQIVFHLEIHGILKGALQDASTCSGHHRKKDEDQSDHHSAGNVFLTLLYGE